MPRYEYDCEKCGPFEVSQKISDAPLTSHTCGAPAQRVISRTSFILEGGGWYADGYGAGAGKPAKAGGGGVCTPTGCEKPSCAAKDAA